MLILIIGSGKLNLELDGSPPGKIGGISVLGGNISDVPAQAWPESPGLGLASGGSGLQKWAFKNVEPGQKPSQANPEGPAWPGFFGPGLARPGASGRSRHITRWYGATENQSASLVDSNFQSLSLEPLPHRLDPSISSSIFVRSSYVTMFDTVWAQSIASEGRHGVIITGQPGTGKTLFHYYLLVRLLQLKQVVLFSPKGKKVYLFYFNEVYTIDMKVLAAQELDVSLPNPIFSSDVFIWSLFDIRERKEPESFLERRPLLTGLPLWTRDELAQGLQYQAEYRSLFSALRKPYRSTSPNPGDPLDIFPGARALLEERCSEEDAVPPSLEDALDYLLDASIHRFGYSARDVFDAVFDYLAMTRRHEDAFDLRYSELQAAVSALSKNRCASHTVSHRILALSPVDQGPLVSVRWNVDFKSDWVARNVIQELGEAEDIIIRQQISYFRSFPEARGLARRLFEPLVHRYIANATDGFWPLTNMNSNAADPPHFTLVRDSSVPDAVRFIKVKRKIVKLQSTANLSTCLENNSYYIPADPNFPLFDAFTIELNREERSAILWVLQVTTSRMHGGSTMGYQKIREIIVILKDELWDDPPLKKSKTAGGQVAPTPLVQVRYLLVVPKDESERQNLQWQFPKGWSQNQKKNDHCGNVYCLEVPLVIQ